MIIDMNYIAILIASIAQFAFGGFWFTVLFKNLWAKIHNYDKKSKEELKKIQPGMPLVLFIKFLSIIIMTIVLSLFILNLPFASPYFVALIIWLGFVLPVEISAVIFGDTEKKWMLKKILVTSVYMLISLMLAVCILNF